MAHRRSVKWVTYRGVGWVMTLTMTDAPVGTRWPIYEAVVARLGYRHDKPVVVRAQCRASSMGARCLLPTDHAGQHDYYKPPDLGRVPARDATNE